MSKRAIKIAHKLTTIISSKTAIVIITHRVRFLTYTRAIGQSAEININTNIYQLQCG